MISLVGYTGFVGSNLYDAGKDQLDRVYNSNNIEEAFGTEPELLIYAGLRAEKYLANQAPEKDFDRIKEAQENICRIAPKKLVLISTVDVYKNPVRVDEDSPIETAQLHPYGYNRYLLEQWVREHYKDALIIRLPGLYGKNMKKNFIYDYINVIPFMLKEEKFTELLAKERQLEKWAKKALLPRFYEKQGNGFFKCSMPEGIEKQELKELFQELGFTALNFTDSRNIYQFYPLSRLWEDIKTAETNKLRLWNPATEPVTAAGLYRYLSGQEFMNETAETIVQYDYRTRYAELFGGKDGYIMQKEEVMEDIKYFAGVVEMESKI